ncbi:FabD/lysophospholipase-like protein [Polyplosphaeria fusca]|uniref:FabD/lysophospholipase-like protein n=1 Tax=Polyplosphaeria fusca TaxID=682080 RepID=A0A9P4QV27_9PLEO|nr:FabD/lysophospholipase-like protein [Polyplosphaeria fusca]
MQSTATAARHAPPLNGKQLRLLCLDGGVRGMSSLLILKKLMEMIDPDDLPKPCDYFDMISGTGRLQMSVQECINEYKALFSSVFKIRHRVKFTGKNEALENGIKEVVRKRLGDANALFKDSSHRGGCKTFVCATSGNTLEPVVISSYYSDRCVNDLREISHIWEIGAAMFLDGGMGANNPVIKLWEDAQDMFCNGPGLKFKDNLICLVSIGTGLGHLKALGNSEVGLEEADKQGLIEEATRRYITLERSNADLRKCKG